MTATVRNTSSATQFWGSSIANVPIGGRKKKLNVRAAAIDTAVATQSRPATVAAPSTTRISASATVAGLTPSINRRSPDTAATAPSPASRITASRGRIEPAHHRQIHTRILSPRGSVGPGSTMSL
jgi:hypothetical protein